MLKVSVSPTDRMVLKREVFCVEARSTVLDLLYRVSVSPTDRMVLKLSKKERYKVAEIIAPFQYPLRIEWC